LNKNSSMNRSFPVLSIFALLTACSQPKASQEVIYNEGHGISADSGMVVSANKYASRAGIEILKMGGNAVDAAVATEFSLAVCYPEAGNIGGGGFMVIRTKDGNTDVIDYREKAPALANRDMYLDKSGNVVDGLSTKTGLASGVPGTVDGMIKAHSKYGRLPFKDVIQPAISLAENGFPLNLSQAANLNSNKEQFIERNGPGTAFVKDSLWKEGDLLIQKDLAETLKRIRDYGRDGFYSGKTAGFIIKAMKKSNGIISFDDLNAYKSVSRVPLTTEYHGFKVITVPPPSGGGIILIQLLGMVEPFNLPQSGFHTLNTIHLMVEAERRAFADRAEYMGDPDFMKVPAEKLIAPKYIKNRMADYNSRKASASSDIKAGNPALYESEETTHYSVVDYEGNAVSATTTLNGTYGSSIVADSAGFLMNNQMDDFSVKPGFPNMYGLVGGETNSVQPGKRMLSSMTPVIVEKDGKLFLVAGSPGGSTIPTTVFQTLVNVLDFGMPVQSAVDTGRFHHQWLPDQLIYETNSLDSLVLAGLAGKGHELKSRSALGRVNAILVDQQGRKTGGADKRGDNSACGY
jgi:gamma-glutamyltranspeptidase/glutathione hydrolase